MASTEAMPQIELAQWTERIHRSELQNVLTGTKPAISFALGLPAPELFPVTDIAEAVEEVLRVDRSALQYGPPSLELKEQVVELMKWRRVAVKTGQVFLTSGAQQGLSLLARLLLNPGGRVLCDELAYSGFQQAVSVLTPQIQTVRSGSDTGIDSQAIEQLLVAGMRPAFIYAMSEGHNPLSVSMSARDRERLARIAARFSVPVVEDDAYGFLQYESDGLLPMRGYEERWVLYVGSFSKILCPSFRVGWLIVPEELQSNLAILKEASDIDTSTFCQKVICAYLRMGRLKSHISALRTEYRQRRDAMLEALAQHFPDGSRWSRPAGGVFIWVEMPAHINTSHLLRASLSSEGIAFLPGSAFAMGDVPGATNCMRLNFSHACIQDIQSGIERLGRLSREFADRRRVGATVM